MKNIDEQLSKDETDADEILEYIKEDLLNLYCNLDEIEIAEFKSQFVLAIVNRLIEFKIEEENKSKLFDIKMSFNHSSFQSWYDENYG